MNLTPLESRYQGGSRGGEGGKCTEQEGTRYISSSPDQIRSMHACVWLVLDPLICSSRPRGQGDVRSSSSCNWLMMSGDWWISAGRPAWSYRSIPHKKHSWALMHGSRIYVERRDFTLAWTRRDLACTRWSTDDALLPCWSVKQGDQPRTSVVEPEENGDSWSIY